jgi:hypothetical protein
MKKTIFIPFVTALLIAISGFVADDFISELRSKFKTYSENNSPAKLSLSFNQPVYAPGDSILFKTLYINAAEGSLMKGREIVNFQIQNQQGVTQFNERYSLKDGFGSHKFIIPEDVAPGNYRVVAYTNWMRNHSSDFYFNEILTITGQQLLRPDSTNSMANDIVFNVLGENIIKALENEMSIQLTPSYANKRGIIKNSSGTSVVEVIFDNSAFAKIKIIPEETQYYLEVIRENKSVRFNLPEIKEAGFVVNFTREDNDGPLRFNLKHSPALDKVNEKFFLIINNYKDIVFSTPLTLTTNESSDVLIPAKYFEGDVVANIISDNGKVWSSMTIIANDNQAYNLTLNKSKIILNTREDATVNVSLKDVNNNPIEGQFSVRIIPEKLFSQNNFSTDNANSKFIKPWVEWGNVTNKTISKPNFLPQKYLTVSGKAFFLDTKKPVADSTLISFFFEKEVFGYETYCRANGEFSFPIVYNFTGDQEVFYSASLKGKDVPYVALEIKSNEESAFTKPHSLITTNSRSTYGVFAQQRKLINNSFTFFNNTSKQSLVEDPNFAIEDELNGADISINLNDYVVFPTMADIIKEVLPAVEHRKTDGKDFIRIYTTHKMASKYAQPLYVIDGSLSKDTKFLLSIDPKNVSTIKVIKDGNKLSRFGSLFSNGVILVRTKNSSYKERLSKENKFTLHGLLETPVLQTTKSTTQSNIPDVKSCLYWNPQVTLDSQGQASFNFTTSDDTGIFKIQIEGITSEGKIFKGNDTLTVVFNKQ